MSDQYCGRCGLSRSLHTGIGESCPTDAMVPRRQVIEFDPLLSSATEYGKSSRDATTEIDEMREHLRQAHHALNRAIALGAADPEVIGVANLTRKYVR